MRVALYAGTSAQTAPALAALTLLRGSGDLEDDGHESLVSDVACTLRRLHVPLLSESVSWRLTTRGLVFHAAVSEQEQEAQQVASSKRHSLSEETPRLLVTWAATAALSAVGDVGVAAVKPSGACGRDVVLRCSGGQQQRNKLLRLASRVRDGACGGSIGMHGGAVVVNRVVVVTPHVVRTKLPPRERVVARSPHVGCHIFAGRVPPAGSVRVELLLAHNELETVVISGAALASTAAATTWARFGTATSDNGRVSLRFVATSRLSSTARRRLRLGAASSVIAAAVAASTPGYASDIMDSLVAVLLIVATALIALAWQPSQRRRVTHDSQSVRRLPRVPPPLGSEWTLQLLSVRAQATPSGDDDDSSSDAASDAGDDDDGPPLNAVEFLSNGSIHPLWSRYVYVWGDAGKEPPPPSSLAVPGRLPDALARVKFRACLRWRREAHMDEVLVRPQPHFHLFKRLYPHAFHGRSRSGAVIFMEKSRFVRSLALGLAAAGATPQQGAHHVVATLEFLAVCLDPRPLPGGRAVRVVDASGVSFGDVASGEVLRLLRACAVVLSPFFPERIEKLVIINAPQGFSLLFSMVSQFMSKRTQARVVVVDAGNDARRRQILHDLIDPSQLPVEFDGTCTCAGDGGCWRQHPLERQLWTAVERTTPVELRKGV